MNLREARAGRLGGSRRAVAAVTALASAGLGMGVALTALAPTAAADVMSGALPSLRVAAAPVASGVIDVTKSTFELRMTAGGPEVVADGVQSWTATITAKDASNEPVLNATGLVVSPVVSNSRLIISQVTPTQTPGVYTALITTHTPGEYGVVAKLDNAQIGTQQTALFVAGPPGVVTHELTVGPASVPADGVTSATITVRPSGPGPIVVITKTAGPGSVSGTVTNPDGSYTATITSPTPGTATVSFRLNGVPADSSAPVEFTAAARPATPVVDPSNGRVITGTAEPGLTVTVTHGATGEKLCTTKAAESDGAFECVPRVPIRNGTEVSVTATNDAGISSEPAFVTIDARVPGIPVVDSPSNGVRITGTAEPGSTVKVSDEAGTVVCTTKADAVTGEFECVPDVPLQDGVIVKVTATDAAGNVSQPASVTIDAKAPGIPVVDTPTSGERITGTAEPGSTVKVTDEAGTVVCTTAADAVTGEFECVPDVPLKDGVTVKVTATDAVGNVSEPALVTVGTAVPSEPPVNPSNRSSVPSEPLANTSSSSSVSSKPLANRSNRSSVPSKPLANTSSSSSISSSPTSSPTPARTQSSTGGQGPVAKTGGHLASSRAGVAGGAAAALLAAAGILVVMRRRRHA